MRISSPLPKSHTMEEMLDEIFGDEPLSPINTPVYAVENEGSNQSQPLSEDEKTPLTPTADLEVRIMIVCRLRLIDSLRNHQSLWWMLLSIQCLKYNQQLE